MRRNALLAVGIAIVSGVLPSVADAKNYAPPGKAGSSQYSEVIPSAGGNVSPPKPGAHPRTAAVISRVAAGKAGVRKLTALGKEGAAAARFAQATAPVVSTGTRDVEPGRPATGGRRRTRSRTLTAPAGSALSGFAHLLGGSDAGGIGIVLPLLLAFALGAVVGVSALRVWRGRRPIA